MEASFESVEKYKCKLFASRCLYTHTIYTLQPLLCVFSVFTLE